MEDMTNRQIVLLTMLVSFVVSTATGIVTVAMLEEAPPVLTQTINRVVERTIERVVTGTSTAEKAAPAPVTTITKEVTIYAKEDDLVVSAVEKNQPRIAKIYGAGTATSSVPDTVGFIISRDGMIATDAATLSGIPSDKAGYVVIVGDREYTGSLVEIREHANSALALIKISVPEGESLNAVTFGSVASVPKVAQSVVVLGGENGTGIFKATLSKLITVKAVGTSTPSYLGSVETSPRIPLGFEGSLVVNLDGQAVGLVVKNADDSRLTIFPAGRIFELVSTVMGAETDTSKAPATKSNVAATGAS